MKKIISIILTLVLTFSINLTVSAKENNIGKNINENKSELVKQANISKIEAQKSAEKFLKDNFNCIIDDKFDRTIEYRKNYEYSYERYAWYFDYGKHEKNKDINVHVIIDDKTGKVFDAVVYENKGNDGDKLSKITKDEALEIAVDFLKKVAPEEEKNTEISAMKNDYSVTEYDFKFIRVVNNIKYDSNLINVGVDGVTKKVNSYHYKWDDELNISKVKDIISENKAAELYKNDGKMELEYVQYTDKYSLKMKPQITLMYKYNIDNVNIDAKTGKFIDIEREYKSKIITADVNENEKKELFKKAVPINKFDKQLNRNEAEKLIKKYIKELYGANYIIKDMAYSENTNNTYNSKGKIIWTADFYKKYNNEKDKEESGNISIDAENGAIINMYKNSNYDNISNLKDKLTYKQAYKKALDFIIKNCPDKIKNISLKQEQREYESEDMRNNNYYFSFVRLVNGVKFRSDTLWFNFNRKTGELLSFSSNWNEELKFPALDNIISEQKAEELFYKLFKPELRYEDINEKQPKLVYKLCNEKYTYLYLDALTGKYLNYNGEEIDENIDEFYKKIKGNKYERMLLILQSNNIIYTKGFDLNKEITTMDFIKMIVNAKGYNPYLVQNAKKVGFETSYDLDSSDYKYLQLAVYYGIIDNNEKNFDENKKMTRKEMAQNIVNIIGYSKLAQCDDIFTISFDDTKNLKKSEKGYIAIAKALKILETEDNKIRPDDNADMLELCTAIYNCYSELNTQSNVY